VGRDTQLADFLRGRYLFRSTTTSGRVKKKSRREGEEAKEDCGEGVFKDVERKPDIPDPGTTSFHGKSHAARGSVPHGQERNGAH